MVGTINQSVVKQNLSLYLDGQGFTIWIKGGNEGAHNWFLWYGETGVVKNVAFVGAGKG